MYEAFTLQELEEQRGELLPERTAMQAADPAVIWATNVAVAINAAWYNSASVATATQHITIS